MSSQTAQPRCKCRSRRGPWRKPGLQNGMRTPGQTLLLKAKLALPPAQPMSLSRPRLLDLMSGSLKRPLTLLCAPAGFGKTTLLSAWVNENVDRPDVAWLGLDEDDND